MDKLSEKLNLRNDFPETTIEEWKKVVEIDLKGVPFEKKLITKTYEEINLSPVYTQENLDKIKSEEALFSVELASCKTFMASMNIERENGE